MLDAGHPVRGVGPAGGHARSGPLRDDLVPAALGDLDGDATYAVGGGAAESLDFVDREQAALPLVIGFVLLLTLLMMGFAFRSVPIALVSTVLNLASVGVAFGILTLVFQHGWGAGRWTSPARASSSTGSRCS